MNCSSDSIPCFHLCSQWTDFQLYSFIRVFETSELTLILQGRSEHDSHMDDVLTLSFKLNSGSFNTIGECVYELSGESVQ